MALRVINSRGLLEQRELHHIIVAGAEIVGVPRYGDFSVNTHWYTPPCAQAQVRASDTADKVMIFLETL